MMNPQSYSLTMMKSCFAAECKCGNLIRCFLKMWNFTIIISIKKKNLHIRSADHFRLNLFDCRSRTPIDRCCFYVVRVDYESFVDSVAVVGADAVVTVDGVHSIRRTGGMIRSNIDALDSSAFGWRDNALDFRALFEPALAMERMREATKLLLKLTSGELKNHSHL